MTVINEQIPVSISSATDVELIQLWLNTNYTEYYHGLIENEAIKRGLIVPVRSNTTGV